MFGFSLFFPIFGDYKHDLFIFYIVLYIKNAIMSNKRNLKRIINYVCSDLFSECVAASLYSGKPNKEDVEALLTSVINIQNDFVRRVSHPEPGIKAKQYYKALINDFNKQVSEIIDQISNMS